jgi:hypothetical protein
MPIYILVVSAFGAAAISLRKAAVRRSFSFGDTTRPPSVISSLTRSNTNGSGFDHPTVAPGQ